MVKLYICLKNDNVKEIVHQVCKDIFVKDSTFKFTIFKNKRFRGRKQDCMHIVSIDCKDVDEAHRKGTWFVNKVDIPTVLPGNDKLYYWVREK
jgi:hypothetical protein